MVQARSKWFGSFVAAFVFACGAEAQAARWIVQGAPALGGSGGTVWTGGVPLGGGVGPFERLLLPTWRPLGLSGAVHRFDVGPNVWTETVAFDGLEHPMLDLDLVAVPGLDRVVCVTHRPSANDTRIRVLRRDGTPTTATTIDVDWVPVSGVDALAFEDGRAFVVGSPNGAVGGIVTVVDTLTATVLGTIGFDANEYPLCEVDLVRVPGTNTLLLPTLQTLGNRARMRFLDPDTMSSTVVDLLGNELLLQGLDVVVEPGAFPTRALLPTWSSAGPARLRFFDLATRQLAETVELEVNEYPVVDVDVPVPNGSTRTVVLTSQTLGGTGRIRVVDWATRTVTATIALDANETPVPALDPVAGRPGQMVVVTHSRTPNHGVVRLVDTASGSVTTRIDLETNESPLVEHDVHVSADAEHALLATWLSGPSAPRGRVRHVQLATGAVTTHELEPNEAPITGVDWVPLPGGYVALPTHQSATSHGQLVLVNERTGAVVARHAMPVDHVFVQHLDAVANSRFVVAPVWVTAGGLPGAMVLDLFTNVSSVHLFGAGDVPMQGVDLLGPSTAAWTADEDFLCSGGAVPDLPDDHTPQDLIFLGSPPPPPGPYPIEEGW